VAAVAGSNFDHEGNEERILGDVGPKEMRVHIACGSGDQKGKRERVRERLTEGGGWNGEGDCRDGKGGRRERKPRERDGR